MLRESATGTVYRAYTDRGSGLRETRAGLNRMLDDAARGHVTVVRVVWRDRLARFGVAWIERYLSVVGVKVEVLREQGDTSLVEELMDDFMAVLASFSGRFHRSRSTRSQRRRLRRCGSRVGEGLADGRYRIHCAAAVFVHHPPLPGCR
ncbi:recombinase family protein [Rhodococcus opacus]|uniref:recombinase family protein n=1 Tax=Rhodococcus opacus TaxID=37919 RepID=UPI0035578D82